MVSRQAFFGALPKLIWHEDEPIVWPSSVALYFVAKLARERVTVVLTGEGSDETLAGYTRYAWTLWNARLDRIYRDPDRVRIAPDAPRSARRIQVAECGPSQVVPTHFSRPETETAGVRSISTISTRPFPKLSRPISAVTTSNPPPARPTGIQSRGGRSVREIFSSGFFTPTSRLIWWSCS